jgi:uncharacterized protein (UPF0276 family)
MQTGVGIGWRHPHYQQVLQELPALDFLEVHSENFFGEGGASLAILERARERYPLSLHGVGLSLGSAIGIDPWHLDQLARLVDRIEPALVSDHACFARASYQGKTVHAADLLPLPFDQQALDVLCSNVQRVQDRLRRPLLVENLSAYIGWAEPAAFASLPEPEFLNTLSVRTGCGLLVDVNNIYVNALNAQSRCEASSAKRGEDALLQCIDWLNGLLPEAVGEVHLAGHCRIESVAGDADGRSFIAIDDHGSRTCTEVWRLYAHALWRFGPVPTLIEWDTNLPALSVLLEEATTARQIIRNTEAVSA